MTAALLAALTIFAASLGPAPAAWASSAPGQAWVRAAHAVPAGTEGMDVVLSRAPGAPEQLVAGNVVYGDVSEYLPVPAGDYTVTLRPTGAGDGPLPTLSTAVTARAGQAVTFAALGSLDAPRLATLQDDLTPPPAGSARVRLLPAASSAPSVDVTAQDGPVIAEDAVFGQATPYAEVPAGPWTLSVVAPGGTTTASVVLDSGSVYTALITDGADGGLALLPVVDAASTAIAPAGPVAAGAGGGAVAAAAPVASPGSLAGLLVLVGSVVIALSVRRVRERWSAPSA